MRNLLKKRSRRMRKGMVMALAISSCAGARAVEITPVFKGSIMGGQYFLYGANRSSLGGNASAVVAPVMTFSERWTVLPAYHGDYYGTKGVGDGVGAGTLFQQKTDHKASVMTIYSISGTTWRLKPSASYKREFLKETLDETWTKGLFDYEKIAGGFEVENLYKDPFSMRFVVDFYRVRFPNYKTLESAAKTDPQGNPLNRELASKNVLDTYNYSASFHLTRPIPFDDPKVALSVSASSLYQKFIDQRLINQEGQVTTTKPFGRKDYMQSLSATVAYPKEIKLWDKDFRHNSAFTVTAAHNGSNQNTFDAARTRFVFDAYSYYSYGLGPSYNLAWGDAKRPASASLSFMYKRLQYVGRLAQNADGLYNAKNQWQDTYTAALGYSYPFAHGLNVKAQTSALWATSNMAYEKTYLYTYRTTNYMLGFTYEY